MRSAGINDGILWGLFVYAMLLLLFTHGCASQQVALNPTPTPILPPPVRAEVDETGQKENTKEVTYIEPPVVLNPSQYWRAFKDGAICFRPRGWRAIQNNLTEWPKTWESQKKLIENHNKQAEKFKENTNPWWEVWKFEW